MPTILADSFTASLGQLNGAGAETGEADGVRSADGARSAGPAVPSHRQVEGSELLVGARQPRHPHHRAQGRRRACCLPMSATTTTPIPGPSGGGSKSIRRPAPCRSWKCASGSRRSRRRCRCRRIWASARRLSRPRCCASRGRAAAKRANQNRFSLALGRDDLLSVGVPEDWLADVAEANDDTFLALADHLPAEAAEALLEYVSSGMLKTPERLPAGGRPLRASRCAAAFPDRGEPGGAEGGARIPVGEMGGLPASRAARIGRARLLRAGAGGRLRGNREDRRRAASRHAPRPRRS